MMREVMQNAGLSGFAEIGILIFFGSFLMIFLLAFFGMSDKERDEMMHAPLEPDTK